MTSHPLRAEKGREKVRVPVIVAIMTEICFRHTWNYLITVDYIYCLLMHYSTILFFIVKYATMITKFQRSGYKFLKFFLAAFFFSKYDTLVTLNNLRLEYFLHCVCNACDKRQGLEHTILEWQAFLKSYLISYLLVTDIFGGWQRR